MSLESIQYKKETQTPQEIGRSFEKEPLTKRLVTISDVHNDIHALHASLEQRGLVTPEGDWRKHSEAVRLVITGDSVNKHKPNPEVLRYLRHLQKSAPEGSSVTVLVGNHELDLLTRETLGEDIGLKEKKIEFMGAMRVVHKEGPVLFLHRYPSLTLVAELEEQFSAWKGHVQNDEWNINRRFHDAFLTRRHNPDESISTFRECDDGGEDSALEGMPPAEYYRVYGATIAELLNKMGVTVVVHGHKRQKTGGQQFEEYIPGITMIDNDTAMSADKNDGGVPCLSSSDITVDPDSREVHISSIYMNGIGTRSAKPVVQNTVIPLDKGVRH